MAFVVPFLMPNAIPHLTPFAVALMVPRMGYSKGVRQRKWEENLSRGKFDPAVVGPTRRMVVPTILVRLVHERARELSAVAGFIVTPTMALAAMLEPRSRAVLLGRERGLRKVTLEHVIRASEKVPMKLPVGSEEAGSEEAEELEEAE